jgi:glucokinase
MNSLTIGIDIGGTKVLGGVVTESGEVIATSRKDTPEEGGLALVKVIANVAKELMDLHQVTAVGISTAGFISSDRKTVLATPNIAGWNGLKIYDELQKIIGIPLIVENDANAAIWGEYKFGAGIGKKNIAMLTLGTGVGGAVILNGDLYRGAFGVAAELGHIRLIPNGLSCGCGANGCLEQYGSGSALVRIAKEAARIAPDRAINLLSLCGNDVELIDGIHITNAAKSGDGFSIGVFNELGESLGLGIASISMVLDPSHVLIGGGVIEAGEIILRPIRSSLLGNIPFSGMHPVPEIIPAALGNLAGLVGVANLARI